MNKKIDEKEIIELYQTILKIETLEECQAFFDDLCTHKEIESMAQRLEAAKMLLEEKTYEAIIQTTKISSATLSRVSKCIHYGKNGYKNLITKK